MKEFYKLRPFGFIPHKGAEADGPQNNFIAAVTACPTGIAHTFMAAESLEQAALALDYHIRIETQGAVGIGAELLPEEIARASFIVIAADREVDHARFSGKRVYETDTKTAIINGEALIKLASEKAAVQGGGETVITTRKLLKALLTSAHVFRHLMKGLSFMLPFAMIGGLCSTAALYFAPIDRTLSLSDLFTAKAPTLQMFLALGRDGGFALMIPMLAAAIGHSIANRAALAPAMIAGLVCNAMQTGILGAIGAGFLAGFAVRLLNYCIKLPKSLASIKPILLIPLFATLSSCLPMLYIFGPTLALFHSWVISFMQSSIHGFAAIAAGLILGGMMAIDLGGPVNKIAWLFAVSLLPAGIMQPTAAVMAAGITPPLSCALAVFLFSKRFTQEEHKNGRTALLQGLAFSTEGALPFALKEPPRVIPALISGSSLSAALSMALDIRFELPHGGLFALLIPCVTNHVLQYLAVIAAGTLLSALLLGLLKHADTS